jgi:hypothetical protein
LPSYNPAGYTVTGGFGQNQGTIGGFGQPTYYDSLGRPYNSQAARDAAQARINAAKQPKPAPKAPAPKPQPLPFDPNYTSTVANAQRQYGVTTAGLQYQEGRVKQQYGFDDPSDPFNAAAMLERSYKQQQRRQLNTAGDNLYSSAFQRNQDESRFGYDKNVSDLRQRYADALQGIAQQRAQATADRDSTTSSAYAQYVSNAAANRPADPGPSAPTYSPEQKALYAQTMAQASKLYYGGKKTGPAWAQIIKTLGFDPRRVPGAIPKPKKK